MKESRGITPLRTILQNCLNHIENLETNRSISDNYDKEFQDLKQFSETLKSQKEYSCTEGEKEVNRKKNRYKDILPFNVSRVILSEYAGIPGSDYINANFIKGASGSPAYIASQGPLPNTVNDFWRMVVECEVQVIVMACNAQESGKHKCENYWVEKEGEEKRFGMVQICLVKASTVCPDFLVRTMRLKYTNDKDVTEERTVCQFHYSAWPDHGVPPLVRPLLDMVRLVRDTQASETLPVLVHCSAGCGRTGTICAIDFVWGLLRAGKLTEEFSLYNLVKDMRKQRVAMVQTKEQYILVHQAVRELFKEQLRVIESHPYENIDFNGVPLIKDFEEPFYDTICPTQREEICDEKQDKCEVNEKGENVNSGVNKIDAAPPLPRKKRPNVLFSKQEKEAENLTEKNRSTFVEKEREKDASLSGLLGKPRIVKLRALFEKSPTAKERNGPKDRSGQTVSRSHSLGAIRKPLATEVLDPPVELKSKPLSASSPPASDVSKLKNPKSFSRSVPLIKRSKSLKSFSQAAPLCVATSSGVAPEKVKNYHARLYNVEYRAAKESDGAFTKFTTTCDILEGPGLAKECSKRRRSLESLMGEVSPFITWPTAVMAVEKSGGNLRGKPKPAEGSAKLNSNTVPGGKTADLLKHQLQRLSLETEKKVNAFATGIGIRERRNSFRQAVSKNDMQSMFRDRDSQCTLTKKLLASESVLPCRNGLHSKSVKNANEVSPMVDEPDGVIYLEREVPHDGKQTAAKTKSVFDVKKYNLQEKSACVGGEASLALKKVGRHVSQPNSLTNNQIILESRTPKRMVPTNAKKPDEADRSEESKNLFLKKLNSEIYERERVGGSSSQYNESRSRTNCEDAEKTPRFGSGPALARSGSKKTIFRPNAVAAGAYCAPSNSFDEKDAAAKAEATNNERVFPSSSWQSSKSSQGHQPNVNSAKTPKPFECYRCYANSSPIHPSLYCKGVPSHKGASYQTSAGEGPNGSRRDEMPQDVRQKEPLFSGPQKKSVSSKGYSGPDSETSFSSYRKNHAPLSDLPLYAAIGPEFESNDKNLALPPKTAAAGKNSKSYDCAAWSHSVPSRSSGEVNSSDHSSDSSRLLPQYENESASKSEVKLIKATEHAKGINKSRLTDSGEMASRKQNKPEEVKLNPYADFCNYGVIGTSKSRHAPSKYSKDDFLLEEPTAPPRVKRHASVTVPRNTLNGSDHLSPWASTGKPFGSSRRNTSLQAESAWNGTIGVDLDAVAASMQNQEKSITLSKNGVRSGKNPSNPTNSNTKKKQHYL